MPRKELENLRDSRLRAMVKYAATTVPYYQDLMSSRRLSWRDFSTVKDLDLLPTIDKATVVTDPNRFVSTSEIGQKSIQFQTSGTTGERLSVWLDRRYLLSQAGVGRREKAVVGELLGKEIQFKSLYISYPESTPAKIWEFYRKAAFTPIGTNRRLVPISKPLEEIVQVLDEYRPDVLMSYGSFLPLLFQFLEQKKLKCWLPNLVRFGADSLSPEGRDRIETQFKIPVLSNYGSVECLKIGFECGQNSGFHLHEDVCHVRILKANGDEVEPGEKGEVVISNLINRGTVLLNYRLGDIAALSHDRCNCGRTTHRLSDLEGRVEDLILLKDGKTVHPRSVWSIFKEEPRVLQYQLIQLEPSRFELKMVTSGEECFREVSPIICRRLKSILGNEVGIEAQYSEKLSREKSGKFRPVKSLCKPED
jgi:phenylacetate-CoA ligase